MELTSALRYASSVAKLHAQPPLKAAFKAQLGNKKTVGWTHEVLVQSSTCFTSTWLYRFSKEKVSHLPATTVVYLRPVTQNVLGSHPGPDYFVLHPTKAVFRLRWRFGHPEYICCFTALSWTLKSYHSKCELNYFVCSCPFTSVSARVRCFTSLSSAPTLYLPV